MEILGALTPLAAAGLVIIMIGAVVVTIQSMGAAMAAMPFVTGLLAARQRAHCAGRKALKLTLVLHLLLGLRGDASGCGWICLQDNFPMPYIVRSDPQKSFRNMFLNVLQVAVVIGVTLGFALFLWRSGR